MIAKAAFHELPTSAVARLVREAGSTVVAFPFNGTRRWFMLEHPPAPDQTLESVYDSYRSVTARRYVEVFSLLFDHGLDTVLAPSLGSDLLTRGETYTQMALAGLAQLATDSTFLDFYDSYQVRVRFYGNYRQALAHTRSAALIESLDALTRRTLSYERHRLFYGLFANDGTEAVAQQAVAYFQREGRVPDRRAIVESYYGEYVEPVQLFIGFDRFSAYDMPLLALGEEDLYFMVTPSLYIDPPQLREILYDHLYTRRVIETEEWLALKDFYQINRGQTLGVGEQRHGFWYPLPQVVVPPGFVNTDK